ncbi:MAG: glycosyltransferase family 9 protein [Gammaproteobacteria bacterium]
MKHPDWQSARKLLCIRLDSLGDVLMCTPAIRALREGAHGRHITLLTSPSAAALAPYLGDIDASLDYAAPWVRHQQGHPRRDGGTDGERMIGTLAAQRFDAAVIFTSYSQSPLPAALLCLQAGIPLRLAHCRENPYEVLTDWIPEPEPAALLRHEVQRQLDLVAHVGCSPSSPRLSFRIRQHDLDYVRGLLRLRGVDPGRPWILLHPGASAASRRYPVSHWVKVIELLAERDAAPVVLAGSSVEQDIIEAIRRANRGSRNVADGPKVVDLTGALNLGQLGAALSLATVAVTNNSGPAHIAAAIGTPVLTLYALTNPQHAPWHVKSRVLFHDVPCRFCYKSMCPEGHHACLDNIAPERVVNELIQLKETSILHSMR